MIPMAINGFQSRYKGDVVLDKSSWHRCGKAEVEVKSLGSGDRQACAVTLNRTGDIPLPTTLQSFHIPYHAINFYCPPFLKVAPRR